jgi:hypothetical protein
MVKKKNKNPRMKITSLFGLLAAVLLYVPAFGQYLVTYHTGNITDRQGTAIVDGKRVAPDATLVYDSPKDLLWVVVPGKGDVQLHVSANAKKEGNFWVELIATSLHLQPKHGVFFGKPGPQVLADELSAADSINSHLLLQEFNKYHFDSGTYQGGYFFLQVTLADGIVHPERLDSEADSLILRADVFDRYQHIDTSAAFEIGYASNGSAISVVKITPVLDSARTMEAMINSFVVAVGTDAPKDEVYERCYWQIYNTLGKPCMSNYKRLFDQIYLNNHP